MDKDPRAVGADLTGGVEIAQDCAAHCILYLGILKNDHGGFAAKFHGDVFHAVCSRCIDLAPRGDGAGERDLGHARVRDQCSPHIAVALDDVEHAFGQAGLC